MSLMAQLGRHALPLTLMAAALFHRMLMAGTHVFVNLGIVVLRPHDDRVTISPRPDLDHPDRQPNEH
jgi:hypothetical protein